MHVSGALSPSTSLPSLPSSSTLRSATASCLSFPPSAVCLTWGNLVRSACAPPSCTVCNRPPERKPLLLRKSFILPSLRGQSLALQVSSSWRLVSYILSSFLVVHKEGWQVLHYNTIVLVGRVSLWYFLSISLLLGIRRYSILILYFPCPHPGIRHHPNKIWFLFIREWYLETKVCLLPLRHHFFHAPSPNREVENYTNTHLKKKRVRLINSNELLF